MIFTVPCTYGVSSVSSLISYVKLYSLEYNDKFPLYVVRLKFSMYVAPISSYQLLFQVCLMNKLLSPFPLINSSIIVT